MPSAPITRELAERSAAPPLAIRPHHVGMYRSIAVIFLLLTAAMLGLVAYVVLGHAEVVVLSEQEPSEADFVIDVSEKPVGGEVPGLVLNETDSLQQTFPSTSVVKVDAHAEGRVKITSTLLRPQTLIATTRLLTPDGVLFRTKANVNIPANGSAEVDVFADEPGAKGDTGNVASFTIPGLSSDAQRFFKVQTVTPLVGGSKDVHMVTKSDVDAATQVLTEKLRASLTDKLHEVAAKNGGEGMAGEAVSVEVTKSKTDVPVGSEKTEFTLDLTVKAVGTFYDKPKFDEAVAKELKARQPAGRTLLGVDADKVSIEVEKADVVGGRANLRVTAKGTTILSADEPALSPEKIVGVSTDAAKQYLENVDGVASASVKVSPFWVKRLPNVADHIHVEVR